ncbi:MAG: LpxL/LpxP family acyltransferase [Planctomycetota bacterium]|jgi:predicted LPLAT superfamily acyltransferase
MRQAPGTSEATVRRWPARAAELPDVERDADSSGGVTPARRATRAWTGRTRGGYWGNWIFAFIVKVFGLRAAYVALIPTCAYFVFFAPRAVAASLDYLKRRFGYGLLRRLALVWLHFYVFGRILLDRAAVMCACDRFEFDASGCGQIVELLDAGRGLVIVSAHAGGYESAAHALGTKDVPVNVVIFEGETARVRGLMERALPDRQFRLISVTGSFEDSVEIIAALRRGEVVAMLGDRAFAGRTAEIDFLGSPARFPVGPYAVAAAAGAPLVHFFSSREGTYRYRCHAFPTVWPVFDRKVPKSEQLRGWAEGFVRHLEWFLARYPFQWSNLYPFWASPEEACRGTGPRGPAERPGGDPA